MKSQMKRTLCVDFDNTINNYQSGWVECDFIPDPPLGGALEFLAEAWDQFHVRIFSSRSATFAGRRAMRVWLKYWAKRKYEEGVLHISLYDRLMAMCEPMHNGECAAFPEHKPAAFVSLDDRTLTFTGIYPTMDELKAFKPWNLQ
jgi:hypothetical protein